MLKMQLSDYQKNQRLYGAPNFQIHTILCNFYPLARYSEEGALRRGWLLRFSARNHLLAADSRGTWGTTSTMSWNIYTKSIPKTSLWLFKKNKQNCLTLLDGHNWTSKPAAQEKKQLQLSWVETGQATGSNWELERNPIKNTQNQAAPPPNTSQWAGGRCRWCHRGQEWKKEWPVQLQSQH